jgi:hypothetical protein
MMSRRRKQRKHETLSLVRIVRFTPATTEGNDRIHVLDRLGIWAPNLVPLYNPHEGQAINTKTNIRVLKFSQQHMYGAMAGRRPTPAVMCSIARTEIWFLAMSEERMNSLVP